MRADTERDPGVANRGEVGAVQILLAEMHEPDRLLDRRPPMVVQHQQGTMRGAGVAGVADLAAQRRPVGLLGAELDQPGAGPPPSRRTQSALSTTG